MRAIVANEAASGLWPTPFPQGIFCGKFVAQIKALFQEQYGVLGARVNQ